MSTSWRDDDECRVGGARGLLRSKPRFSFNELKLLLEAVKRNRNILLSEWLPGERRPWRRRSRLLWLFLSAEKFNHGVSSEVKKQKWAEITDQVNALGENHREVLITHFRVQLFRGYLGGGAAEGEGHLHHHNAHNLVQMRQIMKKWADLKCDGKRRIVTLRGPNGTINRKKNLGPVEKMVHDILMMSPRGGEVFLLWGGGWHVT